MKNSEIIFQTAVASGIITEDQAVKYLTKQGELPLHTFKGWQERGYRVKKGEKTAIRIQIWKHTTQKPTKEGVVEENGHMFLKTSCFFTESQVEPIAAS